MTPEERQKFLEAAKANVANKPIHVIKENLSSLALTYGDNRIGFLTLTFKDSPTVSEAQKRFNTFRTGFLSKHVCDYISVIEFTQRGVPHFHIVCAFRDDIRTGYSFKKNCNANLALRNLRKQFRSALPRYKFGFIFDLEPIRKTGEALANYVSKYITKSFQWRVFGQIQECVDKLDIPKILKGTRIYNISRRKAGQASFRSCGSSFSFVCEAARQWRRKLSYFVEVMCMTQYEDMSMIYGPKWCYKFKHIITSVPLEDIGLTPADCPF